MKKLLLLFFLLVSFALVQAGGDSGKALQLPEQTLSEQKTESRLAKQQARLERLQGKLKRKVERKLGKQKTKGKEDDNLKDSKTALQLVLGSLGASVVLSTLTSLVAGGVFMTILSLLSGVAGLLFLIGGIWSLVIYNSEKKKADPSEQVLKNSKIGALVWGISTALSIIILTGIFIILLLALG